MWYNGIQISSLAKWSLIFSHYIPSQCVSHMQNVAVLYLLLRWTVIGSTAAKVESSGRKPSGLSPIHWSLLPVCPHWAALCCWHALFCSMIWFIYLLPWMVLDFSCEFSPLDQLGIVIIIIAIIFTIIYTFTLYELR